MEALGGACNSTQPAGSKLPDDLIFLQIFPKLTPKTLILSCRCVCKLWRDVIDSPSFANIYKTHSYYTPSKNEEFGLLLVDHAPSRSSLATTNNILFPSTKFVTENFLKVCSVYDGLICFYKDTAAPKETFLFNPLRGELVVLPTANVSPTCPFLAQSFALGFDSATQTYKIIHLYSTHIDPPYSPLDLTLRFAAEVHELGTTSWRHISTVPPFCPAAKAVSAYGDVHWKSYTRDATLIISFDSKEETFRNIIPLPPASIQDYHPRFADNLFNFKGLLGLSDHSAKATHIDIWILKHYKKKDQYWAREYRISLAQQHILPPYNEIEIYGAWDDGFAYRTPYADLVYYNPKTDSHSLIRDRSHLDHEQAFGYTSNNLLSLKGYGHLITRKENSFDLVNAPRYRYRFKIFSSLSFQ